jgi:P-type E1-E2 ATPase
MKSTSWIEGFSILVAVFICACVTAINDYQKERQFMKLNEEKDKKKMVSVFRNGEMVEIHQDYVLVGDLVNVCGGMEVPADGFLVEAS